MNHSRRLKNRTANRTSNSVSSEKPPLNTRQPDRIHTVSATLAAEIPLIIAHRGASTGD